MACGTCGGNKSTTPRFTWTSADGAQVVRNLNQVQANTRKNALGGTITPE